jgi:hypothetical protein
MHKMGKSETVMFLRNIHVFLIEIKTLRLDQNILKIIVNVPQE